MSIYNIMVFFDYNCPFCYITFKILDELKNSFDFKCVYKPCELYPDIPPQGLFKEELMEGCDDELHLDKKLRILGDRNGIKFASLDKKYNSHLALLLGEYAQENNKIDDFSREIFLQYYENDMDISNIEVLKNICDKIGLDFEKAMCEDNKIILENRLSESDKLMEKLNVNILPTYIIDDEFTLSGVLTKRMFLKMFESLDKQ